MTDSRGPYVFHGADVSYFSGKARPALQQKGLWYREVLPDMREIVERTGVSFIPVLMTPEGEAWQDTSEILDRLEERYPDPPLYPTTPVQRVTAYLIELYSDEVGVLPAMHYRWSFPESVDRARRDFAANSGNPKASGIFADRMASALPPLGVVPDTLKAIEDHTRELLAALCTHFRAHPFLLGGRMSLADCALMGPFYGHLYRDFVPGQLLRETAFEVCHWIERMNRYDPERQGEWLTNDALAPTLREVLRVMADGVPGLVASVQAFDDWADAHGQLGATPERGVGLHEASFRGVVHPRGTRSYTSWMLRRPLDAYAALPAAGRAQVDAALGGTGWDELLAFEPRHRLAKKKNELVLES